MIRPHRSLTPSQAAARFGISVKALRVYERRGLVVPDRTSAGWRSYGPDDLKRVADIVSLRALGLSLGQIQRVLDGDVGDLDAGLAVHETRLEGQAREIAAALRKLRRLRGDIARGRTPTRDALGVVLDREVPLSAAFELPWPWGGERFELPAVGTLNFITGPLGSGKTRFAKRLAQSLPEAAFLGLDRLTDGSIPQRLAEDAELAERVERALAWLAEDGAERSDALLALVVAIESRAFANLVVDMVEEGLGGAAQEGAMAYLRVRKGDRRTLFLMTRSSSILDLDAVGMDEAVIVCPANHSPPFRASTVPGGRGYEAVSTCLAAPDVRARSAGVVAARSHVA